jgi:hypothetical protein
MLPPVAQREAPALAVPPLEPSTPFAARVGAGIFASLALLLLVLALLPGADAPVLARLCIPLACALAALALRVNSDRIGPATLYAAATFGTLLVSATMLIADDASLSGELLYAWLALYAAYFFPIRQAVFQLLLMSVAYLGVLLETVPGHDVVASWITLVAVIFPVGVVLRVVRGGVTQLVRSLA